MIEVLEEYNNIIYNSDIFQYLSHGIFIDLDLEIFDPSVVCVFL